MRVVSASSTNFKHFQPVVQPHRSYHSSLTLADWTGIYKDTGLPFGEFWFNEALSANGFADLVGTPTGQALFANFVDNGGYQRFSDPNRHLRKPSNLDHDYF
ncbi:hypothetical protein [Nodularia spumigena]|jgi:hypothetical protein|uniref:hypothetical protein n=1 Tax=Nodularia spumigena TaxID=70799 RepID=UPI00232AA6C9|nr:hypothetical protein [Nodularia spumigena]MDB9346862.1 hypothetical protein [Nodularia spumigena CS-588/01]MDB9350443.1 hypothetical protein [Nodularia spumigena CS-588/05]MEA5558768.1 hypothetical protein [Nodularia spumigena CH309]